jgi:hypothetical protein
VRVVSVSVLVAEPAGVSIRVVDFERDFSVVAGLPASTLTLVEELEGCDGSTVVAELDAPDAGSVAVVEELEVLGAGWTTVVEELDGGAELDGGSFTTVVDELGTDRSQPASATTASAAMESTRVLIDVSVVGVEPVRHRACFADCGGCVAVGCFSRPTAPTPAALREGRHRRLVAAIDRLGMLAHDDVAHLLEAPRRHVEHQ